MSIGGTDEAHLQHPKADLYCVALLPEPESCWTCYCQARSRLHRLSPKWGVALWRLLGWTLQAGGAGFRKRTMMNIRRDTQSMDQDAAHSEPFRPLAQQTRSHVATLLICQNNLIRSGIDHILSGTQFVISAEAPALCLIYTDQAANDLCETVNRLKTRWPSVRTVLLSDHLDPASVTQAFQAGLDGLCPTTMSHEALVLALELVLLGERFIPADVGLALLNAQPRGYGVGFGLSAAAVPANDGLGGKSLSGREAQILHHITQGASNKVIARDLGLAEATVKVHVKAILRKVKVSNRTQAALWAQQHVNGHPQDAIRDAAE
jgi:two-component system, NarL family, nitrate/nitrite response regulator NarL